MIVSGSMKRPTTVDELIDPRMLARLDRLDLRTRKMFPGKLQGERRSKRRGQSVEFEDYRNYVAGDDLRFIDWNVYARLDRLFIKIFIEEEDLALNLTIDASASMDAGSPNKLLFAARLAMALGYIGLVKQNRVGVTIFGRPGIPGVVRLPDMRGRHQVDRLGRFILEQAWRTGEHVDRGSALAPGPGGGFNEALTTIARTRTGKGVMVLLSDFLVEEGYEQGLKTLSASSGYDTYCLQILAPGEIDPAHEGEGVITGDLRLTDIESGRGAEVTVTRQIIEKYRERVRNYCAQLEHYCTARAMVHRLVRSDESIETLVLDTLRRRGLLA